MAEKFKVVFYKTSDGESPIKNFIKSCSDKMRAKISMEIALLQEHGNDLGMPYSKHIDDGIFELRIKLASNITRVLYFFAVGKRIVLTNGFVKKTQKTPKGEIEKAKKYRKDFIERDKGQDDEKK